VVARLPLHDAHVRAGAVIDAPCGIALPMSYGDPAGEHRAVRDAVGVFDRSHYGVLEIGGPDRTSFLQGMLTNDVRALGPGQGCAAALLDAHGKVQLLVAVLATEDRLLALVPGGRAAKLRDALDRFLFSERVEMRDASDDFATFVVAGPASPATVERLAGLALPITPWHHGSAVVDGRPVRVVRGAGETGGPEAWLLGRREDGEPLWRAILAAGVRPVGLTALDALRVEAGTPWFGHDVDESVLLPEIASEALVSSTKGCYLGQEVVVRVRDRGHVNRRLTGLVLDGDILPRPGAAVVAGGREVGRITSVARSPALGRPIALAFVRREHWEPGSVVAVRVDGRDLAARVTALPFVPPPRDAAA
jgi:aminomethyltransferase